ncbi:hypothetical protein EGR_10553 [Echinococcus granulosus]|uniref:Uncharacterized protein n=1 Tax=Echinococcus granulosus TaxID=6210 RepID=W6UM56_ECHGR|nr:hypothetical protein EGR_10553 [Echinococcus granulosus]EUB54584.1 hypothetical protein EGR_10553 [Echinococcus granulosus]
MNTSLIHVSLPYTSAQNTARRLPPSVSHIRHLPLLNINVSGASK